MSSELHARVRASETVFTGRLITLRLDEVETGHGHVHKLEIAAHPDAAAVVAVAPGERVILVRQPRYAVDEMLLELPAGLIDEGESAEATAIRELEEETGWRAGKVEHLVSFYASPGFCDEKIHVYVATDLTPGDPRHEVSEEIEIELIPLAELEQQIRRGELTDAKTLIGLLAYLRRQSG